VESGFGRDSPRPLSPPAPEREHVVRSLPWTPKVLCNKKERQVRILVLVFQTGFRIRIHFFRIRIQRLRLETNTDPDPDPIRIQGFNDQKLKKITAGKKI
jgi:hypothetical protein